MAKDGTNRGGYRVGSGRKSKPLAEKVAEGKVDSLKKPTDFELEAADLEGVDMPPVKEYMKAKQKNGKDLVAEQIYHEMWLWLHEKGCDKLVASGLIEQYSMNVSRWIQVQDAISEYGFLAKHPTTNAPIQSPYVAMLNIFARQINATWAQIYQIVKENSPSGYGGYDPNDAMERLLRSRKG